MDSTSDSLRLLLRYAQYLGLIMLKSYIPVEQYLSHSKFLAPLLGIATREREQGCAFSLFLINTAGFLLLTNLNFNLFQVQGWHDRDRASQKNIFEFLE